MDLDRFDQREAPGTSASLSEREFQILQENLADVGQRGEFSKDIQIAGYDSAKLMCTWRIEKSPFVQRADCAEILIRERGETIAEMRFIKKHGKKDVSWELVHRLVKQSPEIRGKGIGAYALRSAETLARKLEIGMDYPPSYFEISTARPSLVSFAKANGYSFETPHEEETMARFESELRTFGNDEEYKRFGRLPSFQMLKMDLYLGGQQDEALADRAKLEEFIKAHPTPHKEDEPRVEPDLNSERLVFKGFIDHVVMVPFFIRTHMRKNL